VVPALSRRLCPAIDEQSLAIFWREIPVLNLEKKHKGLAAKVGSAIILACKHGCAGTVCVADNDDDDGRLARLEQGMTAAPDSHAIVCGVAVQSIEAWTLGAPEALAQVLGVEVALVQQTYKVRDVEEFKKSSGKADKRSKDLLEKIAALKHQTDSTEFRETVASYTDVALLQQRCPTGFRPFAEKLVTAFAPRASRE
jgi:hypothetical protein